MLLCAYRHRFHCSLMSIHVFVKHDVIHCLFILCLFCYIFHMLFYNKFKRQTNRTVSCLSSVWLEGHTSQGNRYGQWCCVSVQFLFGKRISIQKCYHSSTSDLQLVTNFLRKFLRWFGHTQTHTHFKDTCARGTC